MRRLLYFVLFFFAATAPALAQENPTFQSRSELVLVPTIVTDKSGHVGGLKQEDFTILDNGKPQRIAFFEEVKAANLPFHRATINGYFTNVLANQPNARQATVILLDMVNSSNLEQSQTRHELVEYLLHKLPPETPVGLMVYTRRGLRILHDLADDPAPLIAALDFTVKKQHASIDSPGPDVAADTRTASAGVASEIGLRDASAAEFLAGFTDMATFSQLQDSLDTLSMLRTLARMLRGVPGRKSVIWMTSGFDMRRLCMQNAMADGGMGQCTTQDFFDAMRLLNDANVALYTVDTRGLMAGGITSSTGFGRSRPNMTNPSPRQDNLETIQTIADMTGGRAYYNTNDLSSALDHAREDSSQYYMLAFYVDHRNADQRWHKLKVSVNRSGTDVRTRSGYDAESLVKPKKDPTPAEMRFIARSTSDFTEVPFGVRWTGQVTNGDRRQAYFEVLMLPGSFTIDSAANNQMSLDIQANAYAPRDARPAGHLSKTVNGHLTPDDLQKSSQSGLPMVGALALAPGEYRVRFVVRDNLSHRLGAVSVPLHVNP